MPLFSQQSSADGVGLYCLTMSWTFNQIGAADGSQCGEEQCREGELRLKAKDSPGAGFQDCCAQSVWKTITCQSGADERSEEKEGGQEQQTEAAKAKTLALAQSTERDATKCNNTLAFQFPRTPLSPTPSHPPRPPSPPSLLPSFTLLPWQTQHCAHL